MRASRSTRTTRSTTTCGTTEPTHDRAVPVDASRGRARLVLGARARVAAPEACQASESLVLAQGRDPRAALPRARTGRPLRLPAGNGARRRAQPRERRDVHRGHRRRQSRRALRPRSPRARLRGADGLPVLLPRHRGVRRGRARRARCAVGRRARPSPLEHVIADAVGTGPQRILITGAGGQLGRALQEVFPDATALTRQDWDVSLAPPLVEAPQIVLHAAAWTDVDGAEADPQGAAAVNVGGTANVAALGAPLVYYSSDYVFDGRKREPYVESDAPNPQSAYGRTKLHGEAAAGENSWIVRSSWLFGATGHHFVRTMLRLGAERDEVAVVDDQRGSPTYVGHLAAATRGLVDLPKGIWHVAADGQCTWLELASAIFEEAGIECRVRPISTEDLGRPAPRPAYSVLRSERENAPRLPNWREGLRACLDRLSSD